MAIVYFWDSGCWNKLATYDKETAVKVVFDTLIFHILGTFEMCAVDTATGEVLAMNTL
jgi:hypothetical protein